MTGFIVDGDPGIARADNELSPSARLRKEAIKVFLAIFVSIGLAGCIEYFSQSQEQDQVPLDKATSTLPADLSTESVSSPTIEPSTQTPISPTLEATGEWGVESPTIALFDKYGVDPATYTLAEVDGVMVGTDNETGTEIFRDGRFEISYAVELAKKDCKPTDIEPSADGLLILYQSWDSSETYISEIMKDLNFPPDVEDWGLSILIDREKQCWVWANSSNIYYRDETGLAKAVPIIHLTEDEMVEFIINGKFKEELISP